MRGFTKINEAVVKKRERERERERETYEGVEVLGVFGESVFDG